MEEGSHRAPAPMRESTGLGHMLKNLKVRTKLAAVLAVPFLALLAVGAIGVYDRRGNTADARNFGLGVAAEYLTAIGMDNVRAHERELVTYALDVLPREVPGIELYGPLDPDKRGGVIPFNLPDIHPHDVAQVLDRFGIAVRAGHHCTMPLHERLDLAATARASFSVYSTTADIDALAAGLVQVQRVFAG